MHHAFSLIFHIQHLYGLYFLPGSNFAPFEEVKVPVSNGAEFKNKKCHLEDFDGFGVVRVNEIKKNIGFRLFFPKKSMLFSG